MSNQPKISVIVPVYNAEKHLRRCVDSILAQRYTDFELLLIDEAQRMEVGVYVMIMQRQLEIKSRFFINQMVV